MKFTSLFILFFSLIGACSYSQTTAIPDANFENYLETHDENGNEVSVGDATSLGDGINGNGLVFTDRINIVLVLTVSDLDIETLSGIEDFDSLETLICNGNNLTQLDVSNNPNLKTLLCASNQLINLDVSANANLEDLDCSDNQIIALDSSSNTALLGLNCSNNRLLDIDVSQNTELTSLSVSSNRITDLQLGNNINLESLFCVSNQISVLNLSANSNLKTLDISNNLVANLDISNVNTNACPDPQTDPETICQCNAIINVSNNKLSSLIVANGFNNLITSFTSEGNPDLFCIQVDAGFIPGVAWTKDDWTYFGDTVCTDIYTYVPDDNFEQALINLGYDNILDNLVLTSNIDVVTALDVSNLGIEVLIGIEDFTALQTLNCSNNNLEIVEVASNMALFDFNVTGNNIESLDLSNNANLTILNVSYNVLNELNLDNNLLLSSLNCSNNNLKTIDLSNHPALTNFNCDSNTLQSLNIQNGQNGNLLNFTAINNPALFCIGTDTGMVPAGVTWSVDAIANYAINCGTYIPDDNFEQALVDLGFDVAPLDNYVPTANINTVTNLDISNYGIIDLTGIEDFVALEVFNCSSNAIIQLNLTTNNSLTSVACNDNSLEFVDIRNGNNPSITVFNATNNESLYCINVDAAIIGNIPGGWMIDPIADYNADCENTRYTQIPDDNFEQALIDLGIDNGAPDNQVLTANIEYLTTLNVSGKNIESLQGIKAFLSLVELDCSNNYLDALDVSDMQNLEKLFCSSNYFLTNDPTNINSVLNTAGTTSLKQLFCADNALADLNITMNTNLEILDCSNNKITALDISSSTNLEEVTCDNNNISNFVSYAVDNTTLSVLSCNNNDIKNLVLNKCLALEKLNCRSNSLSLLDISANGALKVLDFSDNNLTDVNLSANTSLIALIGSKNQLTEIDDLSSNMLESLILDNNEVSQLNALLNGLLSIKYIDVTNNQLTDLDLTNNINLIELKASNNVLTSLQLASNLDQLKTLNCSGNEITGFLDLTTMGTGTCPITNDDNHLDFCPVTITIDVSSNLLDFVNIQNGINADIVSFTATNNPNLSCIQVDDVDNIGANWIKDIETQYSLDCRFGETYVPDDNFEQALINLGYDVGALDDYVPTVNIQVVTDLDISLNNISDLTGIEDFEALENFNCSNNTISTIDVSSNINLLSINCSNNILESIDLANNPNVVSINISNNNFKEFNASIIPLLQTFSSDGNPIIELDFTLNTALVNVSCVSNALEVLNLQNGQNQNLINLNAQNNPELICIQTDDGTEPAGVTWLKEATAVYAINCHFGETYVPDDNFEQALIDLGLDTLPLDDYVPTGLIEDRESLDISNQAIEDLTGIEDFESLVSLNFENNAVVTLDLRENTNLENINASNNQLTSISIAALINLKSLNISNNVLTEIDVTTNLELSNLNVSENSIALLEVSLLLDLENLNCASNQLTELDVSLNPKLIELICTSNLFFQDKLNVQNGANEILSFFNASDNPDLSCILVDDPVAVISNTDGTYDNWFKDASTNYQIICDDADNDGVANEDDLCPGTPFGEPVDLFGCTFSSLPEDNFTILVTGETCLNNNDGKINIVTKEFYEYSAHLVGDDFDRTYTFTNEIDILNLLAGTYRLCITSDEIPNFERCFDIVINHPENLDVITGKRQKGKEVVIQMSGSTNYTIDFNGLVFSTTNSEITLQLEDGRNTIKVTTDKPCQGSFEESIFLSNQSFVYPVPFENELNIYLGDMDEDEVSISISSYLGQLMYANNIINRSKTRRLTIETDRFNSGVYSVFLSSKTEASTFKVVKR